MRDTHFLRCGLVSAAALFAAATAASAQFAPVRIIIADRGNDMLWIMHDVNGDNSIDPATELRPLFSAANAPGTPTVLNPNTLGARADGLIVVGDQDSTRRCFYRLRDRTLNADAQDANESRIAADASNAGGASFAFPTGVAFGPLGEVYVTNAGNGFGSDVVYRLNDLNADGDWNDAGEVSEYIGVPVFGTGNGPASPNEICFIGGVMFVRDSATPSRGVHRAADNNQNQRADDPGEYTPYWTLAASGVAPGAGFVVEPDAARPGSLYVHQTVASPLPAGTDQIIRLTDLNGDNDANDPGEAVLVYQTSEDGLTGVDLLSLPDGRLFLSDNSGARVICLRDTDGDGLFNSAGERSDFYSNATGLLADARSMSLYPVVCRSDLTRSGGSSVLEPADGFVTGADFDAFIEGFFNLVRRNGDASYLADVTDGSGTLGPDDFLTGQDFDAFVAAFFSGC